MGCVMGKIIKKVPVPIAGLMLAFAALGNLVLSYGQVYKSICGLMSSVILIFLLCKIIVDFKSVLKSLENPLIASVAPTFSMGLMILSTYLNKVASKLAFAIWIFAIAIQLMLMVYFTVKYVVNFDIKKVLPSWFIVYVGIAVVSITAPSYGLVYFGQFIFWFAFIAYICLLPIVIYRVFIVKSIPEGALPTIIIFAAPASLCLAGYLSSFTEKNTIIVGILAVLSLTMFIGVLMYLPKLLKLKFYPSYSAFTFPMVISAIAMKLTNGFLIKIGKPIGALKYLVYFQTILAAGIVIYVFIRYLNFLFINNDAKDAGVANKA